MKKAVIITGPGFEDVEVTYPYYRLLEASFSVDIATKDKLDVVGKHGQKLIATVDAKKLSEKIYDLIIIPGGHEAPDRVRQIKEVLLFVQKMHAKKKIIASICHGPWVLISSGIMKGKKATCYVGCKDDLINAGAIYEDKSVIVDENIITSPHFRDLPVFMKTILKFV
jgi:protease I